MAFAFVLLLSSPPDYFQSQFLLKRTTDAQNELSQVRSELQRLAQKKAVADGDKAYASDQLAQAKVCRSSAQPKTCSDKDLQPFFVQEAVNNGQVAVLQSQIEAKTEDLNVF